MANIALLNRCNLKCPYCFASSYTGTEREDISEEAFEKALAFVANDREVGLIGGEPFLHKKINDFLEELQFDARFFRVTIYTNGIFIENSLGALRDRKFNLLINVNSRRDIGEKYFEKLKNNIGALLYVMPRDRITLGINVYEQNQDFSDFLEVVKEYGFKKIRVSLVIPHDKSEGAMAYFARMKNTLLSLYKDLKTLGVSPCYDCNVIPECVFTKEEREFLQTLSFESEYEREIFLGKRPVCSPIVDIYPDLTATRCFGMYDSEKVKITDFKNIEDLKNYFFMKIDSKLVHNPSKHECQSCYKYNTFGCFGGCLCYK